MAKFVITTVSTFINKYAIEADSAVLAVEEFEKLNEGVYAIDDIDQECCQISDRYCGEEVTRVIEVTDEELITQADHYKRAYMANNLHECIRQAPS